MHSASMNGAVFIDLLVAFDIAFLLSGYLFESKQITAYSELLLEPKPLFCGVPQGSIFILVLFTILFSDID